MILQHCWRIHPNLAPQAAAPAARGCTATRSPQRQRQHHHAIITQGNPVMHETIPAIASLPSSDSVTCDMFWMCDSYIYIYIYIYDISLPVLGALFHGLVLGGTDEAHSSWTLYVDLLRRISSISRDFYRFRTPEVGTFQGQLIFGIVAVLQFHTSCYCIGSDPF